MSILDRLPDENGIFHPDDPDMLPRYVAHIFGVDKEVRDDLKLKVGEAFFVSRFSAPANKNSYTGKHGMAELESICEWLIEHHSALMEEAGFIEDGVLTMSWDVHAKYADLYYNSVVATPQKRIQYFWDEIFPKQVIAIENNWRKIIASNFEDMERQDLLLRQIDKVAKQTGSEMPKDHNINISGSIQAISVDQLHLAQQKAKQLSESIPEPPQNPLEDVIIDIIAEEDE